MRQVAGSAFAPILLLAAFSLAASLSTLRSQGFGEAPPPDVSMPQPPVPQATPPLFVPIKPSASTPMPVSTPLPITGPATPAPASTPSFFVPADIPPPAIQATGETLDLIPESEPTPNLAPQPSSSSPAAVTKPAPVSRPAPTVPIISQAQINKMVAQATASRSASQATQVGWAYFNRQEFSSAGIWFNQALEWNANYGEAAYGLAISKFREGDLSSAEAIANFRAGSYPKMKTLLGDIYSRRGTEAYEQKSYEESLEYFDKAAAARSLSRNEQIIVAWDLYYTKQYEKSAQLFEKLYRQSPNSVTAQGAYASMSKLKSYDRLESLAKAGGPIRDMYYTYDAKDYYKANLFLASADSGGAKIYRTLQNINKPSAAVGLGYRTKSGSEGEGQLQVVTFPAINVQLFPANKFMLSLNLAHLNLDSGTLAPGAQVGNVPKTYTPYSYDPTTSEDDLWDFSVRLEYQDWISWYVQLGTTPINGPLGARPTGSAGLIWRDMQGYVQGEIYSKSIKESMLSWVGMVDPYTGQTWGRVQETGGSISFFRSVGEDNTIFLKGGYGEITGTNVKDNDHIYGTAAFAHLLDMPGYEYVSVGFALSYESFNNNQNHFTYGNGGYFSPQYLLQGIIQAQFLTEEGRKWLAAGSVGAGIQNNKQDASPYFPLDDDGQEFDAQESTTGIGLVQVQGGYLINPNWMIGGSMNYNITADYNEGGIFIWGRYFFEPRRGLYRSDLLGFENY